MEKYEKRIKYLDYIEHGNKIRNGGFIRTDMQGQSCRVQIGIKGLYPTDTLAAELFLLRGRESYKVDTMMLHYGKGDYAAVWNTYNLADSGISYEDWTGMVISVSEHRLLRNEWGVLPVDEMENLKAEIKPQMEVEPQIEAKPQIEKKPQIEAKPEVNREQGNEPAVQEKPETEFEWEMEINREQKIEIQTGQEKAETFATDYESKERFASLYEDKWTQLEQYYKTIRPFGDKKTYLSITPGDFIVLDEKYQKLVSNSFLLHGYYNYGHIALSRRKAEEGYQYYLGVPGIYHEREKQVAGMFGFEGFEGAAEKSAEGGFGYYMLQVEI